MKNYQKMLTQRSQNLEPEHVLLIVLVILLVSAKIAEMLS